MSPSCLIDVARRRGRAFASPRPTLASKLRARLTEWLFGTHNTRAETAALRPYHMRYEVPQRSHPFATRFFG